MQQLPDKRLEERYGRLRQQESERPEASLTEACGNGYEAKAAYRFLG
jgi:Transposase DNA-binding